MPSKSAVVMGIDPGYDRIGWCVGTVDRRQLRVIDYGCIETDRSADIFERYQQITQALNAICQQYQPDHAGIETLFFSKNTTTAMRVSEARGVIIAALLEHGVTVSEHNPVTIKQAVTGNGRATKDAVERMVRMQVNLPQKPAKQLDDALDAVAVAMTVGAVGVI